MQFLATSEVARELNVPPRRISDLFYDRVLDDKLCPIVGRRRLIPRDYVQTIREALAKRGKLPEPIPA